MSNRVAVLGGGVGGLSAAHELIERGFDVTQVRAVVSTAAREYRLAMRTFAGNS